MKTCSDVKDRPLDGVQGLPTCVLHVCDNVYVRVSWGLPGWRTHLNLSGCCFVLLTVSQRAQQLNLSKSLWLRNKSAIVPTACDRAEMGRNKDKLCLYSTSKHRACDNENQETSPSDYYSTLALFIVGILKTWRAHWHNTQVRSWSL